MNDAHADDSMCAWMVDKFGSQVQREKYVRKLCSMDLLASYCLTEPGAGSDAANLQATATREGDHYLLSGTKVQGCAVESSSSHSILFCPAGIY